MHLISMKAIKEAVDRFPQHKTALLTLAKTIEKADCPTPNDLKRLYPTLDNFKYLSKYYVIDIANNSLRIVALIFFENQKFYVRHIFTHKEYDRFTEQHRSKGKKK
ncbi:type II toxin-antitoxin system HigB family toxin [Kosakonia oryzae]|uniref:type II toxin-antitoxin system HigB family toxin n=1 Tax=Kosakonia oryzae TaxID=497725 RepID=UPI001D079BB0|nr:type II toxin-antitoxin system HigB family toxin [Kosakonia oryzae]UDJ81791.1 type II toxin-antitoxin system HigB family toxin [Kosakonia oryzae]